MREAIRTGLTAEAGVERVQSDTCARMLRAEPWFGTRGVIVLFSSLDESDVGWREAGSDAFLPSPPAGVVE